MMDIGSRVYVQNTCFTQYATNGDNHGHKEESPKPDNNQHFRSLMKYHVCVCDLSKCAYYGCKQPPLPMVLLAMDYARVNCQKRRIKGRISRNK